MDVRAIKKDVGKINNPGISYPYPAVGYGLNQLPFVDAYSARSF